MWSRPGFNTEPEKSSFPHAIEIQVAQALLGMELGPLGLPGSDFSELHLCSF